MRNVNENYIYKIQSKLNDKKVIRQDENNKIVLFDKTIDNDNNIYSIVEDQNWLFIYNSSFDSYKIVNEKTSLILGYNHDDSKDIPMYPLDTESIYCHWIFENINDEYFIIKNAGNHNKVLDISDWKIENGNNIILFSRDNRNNQQFKLVRIKFKQGYSCKQIKKTSTKTLDENEYRNIDDLIYKIISSEQFIKKWATIAHMLGFSWCAGTNGISVGEDFNVKKEGDKYVLKANYRKFDPFSEGFKSDERLEMEISNIKLMFDPNSIKLGNQSIENLEPILIASTKATNNTDKNASIAKEIEYTQGNTTSNSTSNAISNSIGFENSFKVNIAGVKVENSFSYNFSHEYSWGKQVDESKETKVKSVYTVEVPPNSTVFVHALLYKTKSNVPYEAIANLEYSITLKGFLRYEGNAYKNKPTNRPKISYTFGNSLLSATKDLYQQYLKRDIKGADWDFNWAMINFDCDVFNYYVGEGITPDGAKISGMFTNIDSSNVVITAGKNIKEDKHNLSVK